MESKFEGFHINSPLIESTKLGNLLGNGTRVLLKMDSLQPSGSFKIRGVGNTCSKKVHLHGCKKLLIASGGNAGVATAYSGMKLGVETTIVIPSTTPVFMRVLLESFGATVVLHGNTFDDANELAMKMAAENKEYSYVHPYDDPDVWEGHTSIIQEIFEHSLMKNQKPAAIVTVCGGGGLVCGIIHGLRKVGWSDVPLVVSETEGANSLSEALKAGKLVTLPAMTSIAKTLGAKTVCQEVFDLSQQHPVKSVVVSDKLAVDACIKFADDHRTLVEAACGAGLACVYQKLDPLMNILEDSNLKEKIVIVIVCGGNNASLKTIEEWKQQFSL